MFQQRLALMLVTILAVASFSRPALAFPLGPGSSHSSSPSLCEEGKPDVDDTVEDNNAADDLVVLPCALADTQTGCADAAIYLVTNAGVLLCQIDTLFVAASSGDESFDDAPPSPSAVSTGVFFAAAVPVKTVGLPPVIVHDVVAGFAPVHGEVREGFADFSTPPS